MNYYLCHFVHFVGFFQLIVAFALEALEVESTNSWPHLRRRSAVGVLVADSRAVAAAVVAIR